MVNTFYPSVKTPRTYNTRDLNTKVNELQVIVMCGGGSFVVTMYHVVQDVVSGVRLLVYGKEGMWKLSVLSTQFCSTRKTTQNFKRSMQQEKLSFDNYTQ